MIACIDIGLKRIGIAFSFNGVVSPQNAVLRKNRNQAARDVSEVLSEFGVKKLVIGVPMSGASSEEMQRRIKHFVSLLSYDGEIFYMDEYGSSLEAKEQMKGIVKQKKDGKIDSIAASIILQRYLEENENGL